MKCILQPEFTFRKRFIDLVECNDQFQDRPMLLNDLNKSNNVFIPCFFKLLMNAMCGNYIC